MMDPVFEAVLSRRCRRAGQSPQVSLSMGLVAIVVARCQWSQICWGTVPTALRWASRRLGTRWSIPISLGHMETWDAIRARRNVRVYEDRPIAPEDLDRILEAGWRSPSASNR